MEILLLSILLVIFQLALLFLIVFATIVVITTALSVAFDVPFVRTPSRYFEKIERALEIQQGDIIYELGSGDGRLLLFLGRKYKDNRFVGIELNPILYLYASIRKRIRRISNVEFRYENFFTADLHGATKFYGYLLTPVMSPLLQKIRKEAPGARFVSRAFQFKEVPSTESIVLSEKKGSHGEHLLWIYEL